MTEGVDAQTYKLTLNGSVTQVRCAPDTPLLHTLRQDLGLKGSRFGCGIGLCGACFVMLDSRPVPSCDTPMWAVHGKTVVTVEGLATDAGLHPVQQAFLDEQAAQCAFCVSGVLVSAAALLADYPRPDEAQVVAALDRNLCRCGVQGRMVAAVVRAGQSSGEPA
ncbi:MAG: (2Fe-2S)-binding protein [Jiangellaceae bacterium]